MAVTQRNGAELTDDEQHDGEYYLPARAGPTTEPGPVERGLRKLFHRRGDVTVVVGRQDE